MIVASVAMSVSEVSAPRRLSITLDPGLVLERLILHRFGNLQRKRGQDWLRSLLVQGFLTEGRWIRTGEPYGGRGRKSDVPAIPVSPFSRWLGQPHANRRNDHEPEPQAAEEPTTASGASANAKPFAHLRKVIG